MDLPDSVDLPNVVTDHHLSKDSAVLAGAAAGGAVSACVILCCALCAFRCWWRAHGRRRLREIERKHRNMRVVTAPLTARGRQRSSPLRRSRAETGMLLRQLGEARGRGRPASSSEANVDPAVNPEL